MSIFLQLPQTSASDATQKKQRQKKKMESDLKETKKKLKKSKVLSLTGKHCSSGFYFDCTGNGLSHWWCDLFTDDREEDKPKRKRKRKQDGENGESTPTKTKKRRPSLCPELEVRLVMSVISLFLLLLTETHCLVWFMFELCLIKDKFEKVICDSSAAGLREWRPSRFPKWQFGRDKERRKEKGVCLPGLTLYSVTVLWLIEDFPVCHSPHFGQKSD